MKLLLGNVRFRFFFEKGLFSLLLFPFKHKPASFEILVQILWPQLQRPGRATYALKLTEKKQNTDDSLLLSKSKI